MIKRNILKNLLDALSDTPVVLVTGARQTGKSTLVKHLHGDELNRLYISLDNLNVFQAARSDPEAFINRIDGPVIIDEIQRVPELLLPIKVKVDTHRQSGQFILTGSANLLMLPKVSESLAGRMEILTLYPFSQSELTGVQKSFPDHLYENNYKAFMPAAIPVESENLMDIMIRGSYPEMQTRQHATRQRAWFSSYIKTLLERDIKELSNIDNSADRPLNRNCAQSSPIYGEVKRNKKRLLLKGNFHERMRDIIKSIPRSVSQLAQ
jgi:predicted AAA+ superfamily ATPase